MILIWGGFSYLAANRFDKSWQVQAGKNQLVMEYTDVNNQQKILTIDAKVGDDIEELATYINGQNQEVSASVNQDQQLQIYLEGSLTSGTLSFSGSLASELGMGLIGYEAVDNIDITDVGGAQRAVAIIDTALKYVDSHRAELGAMQNRFNHSINNLSNINENLSASNSRIKDTDYAKETTQLVKQQILQQVSTSILAQAKQQPNLVLKLLDA